MADASPIDVTKALSGVEYPASKEAIVAKAKENGAADAVVKGLDGIADREYEGPSGVTHEFFA